jgi:endo-1,4-beta-xylanase
MKLRAVAIFSIVFAISLASCKTGAPVRDVIQEIPSGKRLREITLSSFPDNSFILGVTCGLWAFDYPAGAIVDREFGYLTPENDFKQNIIHPDNSTWHFENAEIWIEHARANGQILRMHCPIGPQISDWAEEDTRTAEELELNMNEFLTAVCTKLNGISHIRYMDVVNETVKNGGWFGPEPGAGKGMWENPWTKIGFDTDANRTPLYIKKAFRITNRYAPGIKQLYNHHEGPENSASWNLIKETVLYLKKDGIRIDAIGWQAHVESGWSTEANLQSLSELIDWTHANGMEFHVTEASAFIKGRVTEEALALQAETYAAILDLLLEKSRSGLVGWNTWHLTDAYTYRSEYHPALFDARGNAKPAYYAIQKILEEYHAD